MFLTGAGAGIGRLMAVEFAKLGCKLSLSDIRMELLEETKAVVMKRAQVTEDKIAIFLCDVSDRQQVAEGAAIARKAHGPVHILVNNAGIVSGKKILDNPEAMMKKTLDVNTLAHLYTIKEFMPDMIKENKGHIISIASMAATSAIAAMADYCASKSGAFAIDEAVRMEIKKQGYNI